MSSPSTPVRVSRFGVFEADFLAGELRKAGLRIKLHDQPLQILAMLLERPGEVIGREDIHKRLWPADTFVDFDHGLNNAMNRLREALGDSASSPRWIATIPRRGYRFIGAVAETSFTEGAPAEPQLVGGLGDQNAVEAVSSFSELHKGRSYRWLLWAAPAIVVVPLVIAFGLRKAPVAPSSRAFVLPQDGTAFNLIGDQGGPPVLSADGSKLAFVAVDAKGKAFIWVRPLGKLTADAVDGTEGATFPFWSPDGRYLGFFANGKLKKVSVDGGAAVTLCDAEFGRGGSWNSTGTIIFAPASHTGIYKVADSGGPPIQVTTVDTSIHTTHRWPKFLPDGEHFIYLAASHFTPASHDGIYFGSIRSDEIRFLVPSEADATYASGYLFFLHKYVLMAQPFQPERGQLRGHPQQTIEKVLFDPTIWKAVFDASQSGVMSYQLGDIVSGTQLRWFDRSGKELDVLSEPGFFVDLSLSPDGRMLAAGVAEVGYGHIWVYDLGQRSRRQITFGKYDHSSPVWWPDSRRLLFASKQEHYNLSQADSSGAKSERLILDTGSDTWPVALSPDSRFLLFGRGIDIGKTRSQLWVYPTSGKSSPFRLLDGDHVEGWGQFSPDGRWVAYVSNESGRDEVFVVPFRAASGLSQRNNSAVDEKWRISLSGGRFPRWRRDGKELFYLANDDTLMSVPITNRGFKLEIGPAHPLFRISPIYVNSAFSYDVARDGSKFIINTAAPEKTAPITLVENWLSDLKK